MERKYKIYEKCISLLLLSLFLFGFTYLRFFILLLFAGVTVIDLIKHRKRWLLVDITIIILLYFAIGPGRFPLLFQSLERMRFMILQNQYENEAEVILNNYPEDTDYQMIDGCNWMLTSHGTVNYQRKEESAVIFFMTDYTEVSGYVYYTDETAMEYMKDCVMVEKIKDHWLMVQMYD